MSDFAWAALWIIGGLPVAFGTAYWIATDPDQSDMDIGMSFVVAWLFAPVVAIGWFFAGAGMAFGLLIAGIARDGEDR